MAKDKASTKKVSKTSPDTKVTRIKATDTAKAAPVTKDTPAKKPAQKNAAKEKKSRKNPFRALGTYFKGAWHELTQVRWPTRKATWELTTAVLVFTAFFVALIVALDAVFEYLLELMIG